MVVRMSKGKTRLDLWSERDFSSQPIQMQQRGGAWPSLADAAFARGFRRVAAVRASCLPRHGVWADPAFSGALGYCRARCAEVGLAAYTSATLDCPQARPACRAAAPSERGTLEPGGIRPYLKNFPAVGLYQLARRGGCRRPWEQLALWDARWWDGESRSLVVPQILTEGLFTAVNHTGGVQTSLEVTV